MSSNFFDWADPVGGKLTSLQQEVLSGTGEFRGSFALNFGNALTGFVPARHAHIYGTDFKLLCQPSAMLTPGFLGIIAVVFRVNFPSFGGRGNITWNSGQNATANYFGPVINIRRGPTINRQSDGMLGLIGEKLEHAMAPDTHGTPEEQAQQSQHTADNAKYHSDEAHRQADQADKDSTAADNHEREAQDAVTAAELREANAKQAAHVAERRAAAAEKTAEEDPTPKNRQKAAEARKAATDAKEHAQSEADAVKHAKENADQAAKDAQAAKDKAAAARKHADVAKKNSDEARKKADDDRTHADNVKKADEAQKKADEEQQKADEAQKKADEAQKHAQEAKKAEDKARQAHTDAVNEKPFSQAKINEASKKLNEAKAKSQAAEDEANEARRSAKAAAGEADKAKQQASDAAKKTQRGSGSGHGTSIDPAPNLTSGAQAKIDTAVGVVVLPLSYLLCGVAAITDLALKTQYQLDANNFPDEKFLKSEGTDKTAQLLYDLSSKTFVPVLSQVIIQLEQTVFLIDQCIGYAKDMIQLGRALSAAPESVRTFKNRAKIIAEIIIKTIEMAGQVITIVGLVKELIEGFDQLHEANLTSYLNESGSSQSQSSGSGSHSTSATAGAAN